MTMFDCLIDFPKQCVDAIEIADDFWNNYFTGKEKNVFHVSGGLDGRSFRNEERNERDIKNILICGIGGSAMGGEILNDYLAAEIAVPLWVNHGGKLPFWVDSKTLVFVTSYSGNTEETLKNYEEAKKNNSLIVAITSGGKLSEKCMKDNTFCIKIPAGLPPRMGLGFLFFPLLKGIEKLGLVDDKSTDRDEALRVLKKVISEMRPNVFETQNLARKIAKRIGDNLPVIYGGDILKSCISRWKNQFNENAKLLTLSSIFPSLSHNEIEVWGKKEGLIKNIHLIILRDKGESSFLSRGIEVFKTIIQKQNIEFDEVWSEGSSLLARLFSLVMVGDFVSIYLAEQRCVDPSSIPVIDFFKKNI